MLALRQLLLLTKILQLLIHILALMVSIHLLRFNEGVCSWYDFTKSIHRIAGIGNCKVSPLHTDEYPAKAPRPHYSVLDKTKIKHTYGIEIPHWEESLEQCIKELNV